MNNYNERLDDVLQNLSWKQHELGAKGLIPLSKHEYEAKQAITSLTKELVAEAKPKIRAVIHYDEAIDRARKSAANSALDRFEQNLLKALEEV